MSRLFNGRNLFNAETAEYAESFLSDHIVFASIFFSALPEPSALNSFAVPRLDVYLTFAMKLIGTFRTVVLA